MSKTTVSEDDKVDVISHKDHLVIHPPKKLQKKANIRIVNDDNLDIAAIERAENAMHQLSQDFKAWMQLEVRKLTEASVQARNGDQKGIENFYSAAQDIRGHASTYGFPVAGRIASMICDQLDDAKPKNQMTLDRMVEAINAIVRQNARGEHVVAKELERELANVLRRESINPTLN